MAPSVLGRIGRLLRANVGALRESADDPELALDRLIRDYASSIGQAESALARTIAGLRLLEDEQRAAAAALQEWGEKAAAASRKADQLRAAGQTADADRFDELARVALRRQFGGEQRANALAAQVASQREATDGLAPALEQLKLKRDDLVRRRDELVGRERIAQARLRVEQAQGGSPTDPAGELGRFEERVRRAEASAQAMAELSGGSLDDRLASLGADADAGEVESRLARLKAGAGG